MTASELCALIRADILRLYKDDIKLKSTGLRFWLRVFHPRFVPVLHIRLSNYCHGKFLLGPLSIFFSLLNVVLFGIEVTPRCKIGPGLVIPHTVGTVIGASEMGSNVTIFQGVTLGATYADLAFNFSARPILGDDIVIGAGAKVLGGIRIGSNTIIAANSLVTEAVPDSSIAIGVPAIIKIRS